MNKKLIISLIILVLIVIGVIVWWQPKPAQPQPQLVKIGMMGPLTGKASEYGIEAKNGAKLAIAQLNKQQAQYKFELVPIDDKADPKLAKQKAQQLVQQKEVRAVVGSITSPTTLAAGEIFQREGLPAISPSATSPAISQLGKFIFRVCPSDTYQGKALAEFMVQKAGFDNIAILWDKKNASYSGALADSFTQRAEQLGATIISRVAYQQGQKDFSTEIKTVKQRKPEVLFIPGYYTEAALIAKQVRATNWDIPIVGGDGFHSQGLIEIGGEAVEGVVFTTFFVSSKPDPKVQQFVDVYQQKFDSEPGWVAAHGYDAMRVIAEAIEKEGLNRSDIQKGLAEIKSFSGVTGTIRFDQNGDVIKSILRLEVRQGKFQASGVYR